MTACGCAYDGFWINLKGHQAPEARDTTAKRLLSGANCIRTIFYIKTLLFSAFQYTPAGVPGS